MASLRAGDGMSRKTARASSSMVSDCYSSDEDCTEYCKDAVLNWSLDPPSVMILHEGVTNDGDQRVSGPKLPVGAASRASGVEFADRTADQDPPDLSGSNSASEFYRPPSRARTSCNIPLGQTDNASTVALHFSQSCIGEPSSAEYAGSTNKYESGSLFPSNSLAPSSLQGANAGAGFGLCGGGSLGSRAKSEVALNGHLQHRDDLVRKGDRHHPCSPGFVHSVSCRAPLPNLAIKSTSAQFSTLALFEQAVQTSHLTLSRPAPSRNSQMAAAGYSRVLSALDEDGAMNRDQAEVNEPHGALLAALDTVESHVSNICQAGNTWPTGEHGVVETYPTLLVLELHRRVRHLERLLERNIGSACDRSRPAMRQRRGSEERGGRDCSPVRSGDRSSNSENPDLEPASPNKERIELLPGNEFQHDHTCRVFELSPYDDLVRSFQASSDRRIKAVGNKMKCAITIEGPLRIFDSSSGTCWNVRNKLAYRCVIDGATKEAVEKCLKCLQDTFPQSCLNERHFTKSARKMSHPLC